MSSDYVTINSQGYLWKGGSRFIKLPALAAGLLLEHAAGNREVGMRSGAKEEPEVSME